MGALRLFLAISVMIQHGGYLWTGHLRLLPGDMAVYIFFIISGYYISMALEKNYLGRDGGILRFYANRAIRIYPAYLLTVFVVWAFYLAFQQKFQGAQFRGIDYIAVNLLIFGQDWMMFAEPTFQWHYHANAPGWSLAVELGFYAVAPFIISRGMKTAFALIAAGLVSWSLYPIHLSTFPGGIAFFMLGVISYKSIRPNPVLGKWIVFSIAVVMLATLAAFGRFSFFYDGDAFATNARSMLWLPVYVLCAAAIPHIESYTRASSADRFLGDLSYPLYVVHWPLINLILSPLQVQQKYFGFICIPAALIVYFMVDRPLSRMRDAVRSGAIGSAKFTAPHAS